MTERKLTQKEADLIAAFVVERATEEDISTDEQDTGHHGLIQFVIEIDASKLPADLPSGKCIVSFTGMEHAELEYVNPDCIDIDYYEQKLSLTKTETKFRINDVSVSLNSAIAIVGSKLTAKLLSEIQTSDKDTVEIMFVPETNPNFDKDFATKTADKILQSAAFI